MSKDKQTQPDTQSKSRVNRSVQEEMRGMETAVIPPFPSLQRAHTNPRTLSPADAHVLQRTIGNQALGRLIIQRKMTVGPVGDKYEQEADTVAKQIVSSLGQQSNTPPVAQRLGQDEELTQMKPLPATVGQNVFTRAGIIISSHQSMSATTAVQRKGEYGQLHVQGWKYSGGNMATITVQKDTWHASVFNVDSSGKSNDNGLFFDGFHLTYELVANERKPHLFFTHNGVYEKGKSEDHPKTKHYVATKQGGEPELAVLIQQATQLVPTVLGKIGKNLNAKEEQDLELAAKKKIEEQEAFAKLQADELAAKEKAEKEMVQASQDEDVQLQALAKDLGQSGAWQTIKNYMQDPEKKDYIQYRNIADWYLKRKGEGWLVTLPSERLLKAKSMTEKDIQEAKGLDNSCKITFKKTKSGPKHFNWIPTIKFTNYATYAASKLGEELPK